MTQSTHNVRWGILGAGMIARGVVPCIARAEQCVVRGIAAREPVRAREMLDDLELHEAMAYTYEEMLADAAINAIYITLPNHLHTHWTIRCLEARKHVLCEKPLCATRAEAESIAEAARTTGLLAAEGFMYMHHPQTAALVDLATSVGSPLGALKHVHASFCAEQTHEPTIRTRLSHACHGGSMMDLGCYCLSMVHLIAGDRELSLDSVEMHVAPPLEGETVGVDDDMIARGSFADVQFTAESSFRDPRGVHVTLVGERATARTGWPWAPQHERAEITMTSTDGEPLDPIVIEGGGEKFQLQFEAFARAVRNGAAFTPSAEWSVRQAGLIERVRAMGDLPRFAYASIP